MRTSDPDCAFCDIARGNDPDARVVYRDATVVAFFPTEPATLGHTLVAPRVHVPFLWEAGPDLAADLGKATVALAGVVQRMIEPDGLNVIQSNGAAATQTVQHVHIHVVPRWHGDPIGTIWPPATHYTERQKDDAWEAIRVACGELTATTPQK